MDRTMQMVYETEREQYEQAMREQYEQAMRIAPKPPEVG